MSYIALLLWLGLMPTQVLDPGELSIVGGQCELWGQSTSGPYFDVEIEPLLFGPDYIVPELRFRMYREGTGAPISPSQIIVIHNWTSLFYDSDRSSSPRWLDRSEVVTCEMDGSVHEVVVPSRTVRPVGWYDGAFTRFPFTLFGSRKPRFTGLEIVLQFENCTSRLFADEKELQQYRGSVAVITTGCRLRPTTVDFEPVADAGR